MGNFFDEISADEIVEFRETFEEFAYSENDGANTGNIIFPETEKNLLDLILESDSSNDRQLRTIITELIEKVGELNALDVPGQPAVSTDLLNIAYKYKNQIFEHVETRNLEDGKKNVWRKRINEFFDRFTLEIVKRWETIEYERHTMELEELEKSRRILSQENSYLRGIYALSLQIAATPFADKIYEYFAKKLTSILNLTFIIVLDASDKKPVEYIFHSKGIPLKIIESGKRKIEDIYELFKREVIDRDKIEVIIQNPSLLSTRRLLKSDPESVIVPMMYEDNTWGMIGVFRNEGDPFTPQEVQAVSIVTSLVELVSRNQRLLLWERRLARSLDEQISFARKVQERMLPTNYSDDNFIIKTRFKPSATLSGDFYQLFKTDLDEQGVIIGDVTGHDIAAAMMMMTVMGILSDVLSLHKTTFEEMISRANSHLGKTISEQFFVTATSVWLDKSGRFKYINLGHPTGLLMKKDTDQLQELQPTSFPLGIFDEIDLNPREIDFKRGDKILLYTDGLIEAKNESGQSFGIEKLKKSLVQASSLENETILNLIIKEIEDYIGSSGTHDDIAVILIERR